MSCQHQCLHIHIVCVSRICLIWLLGIVNINWSVYPLGAPATYCEVGIDVSALYLSVEIRSHFKY